MPDWLKLPAAALAGAAAAALPAATWGYFEGKRAAGVAALETSVHVLRERGKIDAEISAYDAAGLCRFIGVPDGDYDECVRRLAQAGTDAGERGVRDDE